MKMRLQAQATQEVTPSNSIGFSDDDVEVEPFLLVHCAR